MEKSKLISLRLNTSTWATIDRIADASEYLTRSRIINSILDAMTTCVMNNGLWIVLNSFDPYADGIEIYIKKRNKTTL